MKLGHVLRYVPMKRTNFYYPEPMLDALRALSKKLGLPVSELIRRAIGAFLKSHK